MDLKWNVFYHSLNKKITTFNIFNHGGFRRSVNELLENPKNKDEFAAALRSNLSYYFGHKCEYEVVIKPWCGGDDDSDIKVDAYKQVMNNWDIFLDYVWSHRRTTTT